MREPSIHITKSRFRECLKKIQVKLTDSQIDTLFKSASSYQLTGRKVNISNDRIEKKAKMLLRSEKGDAHLFAKVLIQVRRNQRHRGISIIKEGSKDWLIIKEITSLAIDFCNEFGLDKRTGFKNYISIALKKMQRFGLNKINSMHQGISETYAAVEIIDQDKNKELTKDAHWFYCDILRSKTGWNQNYEEAPDKYVYFVKVAEACIKLSIDAKTYIQAQFDAFAYRDGIPDTAQLTGDKAEERVGKFLYENNKTTLDKPQDPHKATIDFSTLKKL